MKTQKNTKNQVNENTLEIVKVVVMFTVLISFICSFVIGNLI